MTNHASQERIADLSTAMTKVNGDLKQLSDDQVMTLVTLRRRENAGKRFVSVPDDVKKLALREGEELWDFISALASAVMENRVALADGSLDIMLTGIFEDSIIVQDFTTGKMFKTQFTRQADGTFEFGEPVEVRTAFVEVAPGSSSDDDEDANKAITKAVKKVASQPVAFVEVSKMFSGKWSGVLGG